MATASWTPPSGEDRQSQARTQTGVQQRTGGSTETSTAGPRGQGPQGMRQSASLLRREPQQKAETHVCRQLMGEKCREAETGGVRLAAGRGWTPVWVGQEQEETEKRHVKDT